MINYQQLLTENTGNLSVLPHKLAKALLSRQIHELDWTLHAIGPNSKVIELDPKTVTLEILEKYKDPTPHLVATDIYLSDTAYVSTSYKNVAFKFDTLDKSGYGNKLHSSIFGLARNGSIKQLFLVFPDNTVYGKRLDRNGNKINSDRLKMPVHQVDSYEDWKRKRFQSGFDPVNVSLVVAGRKSLLKASYQQVVYNWRADRHRKPATLVQLQDYEQFVYDIDKTFDKVDDRLRAWRMQKSVSREQYVTVKRYLDDIEEAIKQYKSGTY